METLKLILEIALKLAGLGGAVILNVFIWGSIATILKRGKNNGNDKNIHKH